MSKQKTKNVGGLTILLIGTLSFGGFAAVYTAVTGDHILASVSQAKDGEDSGGDNNDNEDSKDSGGDSKDSHSGGNKENKAEKESVKKAKEAAKQKADWQREQLKRKTDALRRVEVRKVEVKHTENESEDTNDDHGNDGVENEAEHENEVESMDDNAPEKIAKHRTDALEHMSREVIDTEEHIARSQAEGIDVTKALATLAAAKERLAAFEQSKDPMTRDQLKQSEREVKKLAYFAKHKEAKSTAEISKDIDKISKRIAQTKGKLALYEKLGGTSDSFKSTLASIEGEFASIQTKLGSGGQEQTDALAQLDSFERKVKGLKNSIETAIYALGGTDQRYDDDYENEIEDIHEHLNDVADIEGDEVGDQIKTIAEAQNESVGKVGTAVENIDKRNRFVQALFGAKKADVQNLENEITANKARIDVLNQTASKIEDPEVKSLLLDQVESLTQETTKLDTFAKAQKDRLSAFGWFLNLFGN